MAPGRDEAGSPSHCNDGVGMDLEHAIGYSNLRGGLHYHPDGKHFVYAAGGTVVISNFNDPHEQDILTGHDGMITCITIGKTGRLIASGQGGHNSDVIVWSFEDRNVLFRLAEHDHGVAFVAFSHDERMLCSGGVPDDRKIFVWDMSNGYIVAIVQHDPIPTTAAWGGMVRDIKRRDTRNYLIATAGNKKISLWSLNPYTGELTHERVPCETRGSLVRDITALAFAEDRETLRCATSTGDFVSVDLRTKQVRVTVSSCRLGALSLLCHAGGTVIGGGDGSVTLFDNFGKNHAQTSLRGSVVAMSFSQDKKELLAGTDQGRIYRVCMQNLSSVIVSENHSRAVTCVCYAPGNSDRFATASADGTVRIWDTANYGVLTNAVVRDMGEPQCLVLALDMMLTGWDGGQILSHDVDTGHLFWSINNAHAGGVTSLTLSHNQRFLFSGGMQGELRVWELRSRDLVSHLKQHTQRVTSLKLFSDDIHALSVSRDRSLICWDLRNESQVSHHAQRMGGINAVNLSRDETTILTVGQEKRVTYWNLREHQPVIAENLSKSMDDEAITLAMSHNGRFFATGGTAAIVKLWRYDGPSLIAESFGHSGVIKDLRFSPDDKQLISVGEDGNIFIWNIFG